MGAKEIEKQTNRKLNLTEESIKLLIDYLEDKVKTKLTQRHFVTAEKDT